MRSSGTGSPGAEDRFGARKRCEHRLRHRVVQRAGEVGPLRRVRRGRALDIEGDAALDATHRETAAAQDVGRLRRPWRDRAEARHDPQCRALRRSGRRTQDLREHALIHADFGIDEIDVARTLHGCAGVHAGEFAIEAFETERRQGGLPVKNHHDEIRRAAGGARILADAWRQRPSRPGSHQAGSLQAGSGAAPQSGVQDAPTSARSRRPRRACRCGQVPPATSADSRLRCR